MTAVTVMVALPLLPSHVAVIWADPAPIATTTPLPFTAATAVFELAHVMVRPPRALPLASRAVAVNCAVRPVSRFADPGLTETVATGTSVAVIVAVPLLPSLVAVTVAEPTPRPVTRPFVLTVATLVFELAQVIARPVNGAPLASFGVAVNCTF